MAYNEKWEKNPIVRWETDPETREHKKHMLTYAEAHKQLYKKIALYVLGPAAILGGYFGIGSLAIGGEYQITWNPFKALFYGLTGGLGYTFFIWFFSTLLISYYITGREVELELIDDRGFKRSETGTKGTASFMTIDEKKEILVENEVDKLSGNILGRDQETGYAVEVNPNLPKDRELNRFMLVSGTSGMGKTYSFVVPQALQIIKRGESCICTDPKGELYKLISEKARKNGYEVKQLNLVNMINSDGCNFLKLVGNDTLMAQSFAEALVADTSGDGPIQGTDYFMQGAKALIAFAILYISMSDEYSEEQKTLGEVLRFISQPSVMTVVDSNGNEMKQMVDALTKMSLKASALPENHPARRQWDYFRVTPATALGSIHSTVTTKLQLLGDEAISAITSYDEIDLELPGKKKCFYFLIIPDMEDTFNFIVSLFYTFTFIKLVKYADRQYNQKLKIPVTLLLDEYANNCTIPGFKKKLNVIRSRGIAVTIIVQDLGQLMDKHPGHGWESIVGACDIQILLGLNEHMTNGEWWAEKTDRMTVVSVGKRGSGEGIVDDENLQISSKTESERLLMTKGEIMNMPKRQLLAFINGYNVIKLDKIGYPFYKEADEIEEKLPTLHKPNWWKYEKDKQWFKDRYALWQEELREQEENRKEDELRKKNEGLTQKEEDKNYFEELWSVKPKEKDSSISEFVGNKIALVKDKIFDKEKEDESEQWNKPKEQSGIISETVLSKISKEKTANDDEEIEWNFNDEQLFSKAIDVDIKEDVSEAERDSLITSPDNNDIDNEIERFLNEVEEESLQKEEVELDCSDPIENEIEEVLDENENLLEDSFFVDGNKQIGGLKASKKLR